MPENLLTAAELAARVRLTPETVRRYVRAGRLVPAGRTPGGQLRFRPEAVAELLAGDARAALARDVETYVAAAIAKTRAGLRAR